jgi:uncharacterized membrane protein
MRVTRPVRRAGIRLGGVALTAAVALLGTAAAAEADVSPAGAKHQGCTWTPEVLPTVPTAEPELSGVNGTDGDRTFAGFSNGHAALWRDGRLIDLGPGVANDVNLAGHAVGYRVDRNFLRHATLWRRGKPIRLAEPTNAAETRAAGINDFGLIVGTAEIFGATGGTRHALVWSVRKPRRVIDLGAFSGDENNATELIGVNNRGTIVGNVLTQDTLTSLAVAGTVQRGLRVLPGTSPDAQPTVSGIAEQYIAGQQFRGGASEPLRWVDGQPEVLPGENAEARAVNTVGNVVGLNPATALLWAGGTGPLELPIPAGEKQAGATAITDSDTVAGFSFNDRSEQRPVLWSCR